MAPFGSWLAAIGTFTLLAGISGYLGSIGQVECGCFGTIQASPWHAFAVDITAPAFLAAGRPIRHPIQRVQEGGLWQIVAPSAYFVMGVGGILACLASASMWGGYSSSEAALAHLRGESVVVRPQCVTCATDKPGERLEAVAEVHNWTNDPIRVYRLATHSCGSCV